MKMPKEAIKGLHQLDQWIAGVKAGDLKCIVAAGSAIASGCGRVDDGPNFLRSLASGVIQELDSLDVDPPTLEKLRPIQANIESDDPSTSASGCLAFAVCVGTLMSTPRGLLFLLKSLERHIQSSVNEASE
jgi:hypothetical protein